MSQVYGARRACPEHDLDVEPTQDRRRADTGALRPPLPYSRSASPLSHAERLGALARLALALYASLSPELKALSEGYSVCLSIVGDAHPPVMLFVQKVEEHEIPDNLIPKVTP
jgi:hypothetical protein